MLYASRRYDHLLATTGFSGTPPPEHFELSKGYEESTSELHEELQEGRRERNTFPPQLAEPRRQKLRAGRRPRYQPQSRTIEVECAT